ncbi:MAG TPA: PDZ domain-containing protein [Saprospiraceae bacterium]|nr:PDZ domain-containing protein [Saprospiraceae bacterium]
MKTVVTFLVAALVLMPWCLSSLFSQQINASPKQIVITKHSVDPDGTEHTETIIKKGKAAENFNVEEYVRNNSSDNVVLNVDVREERNENRIVVRGDKIVKTTSCVAVCTDNNAFLGVEPDSDEEEDEPGLVVQVIRGSAAEKAGLHTNDLITTLDGEKLTSWSDLVRVIAGKKPGDKIAVAYERNGKNATTEATLSTRSAISCTDRQPRGFLGVTDEDDNEEEPGVAVSVNENSAAKKAGLENGDVIFSLNDTNIKDFEDISDFMENTRAGDNIRIVYEREGKRATTEATLGGQKQWNQSFGGSDQNWNSNGNQRKKQWNWDNYDVDTREKDACLGVFTSGAVIDDKKGAQVSNFTDESAAREVQIAKGDLILSINGKPVEDHEGLWDQIAQYKPNDKVQVEFLRDGKTMQVEATLKACRDNTSRVMIKETDGAGEQNSRELTLSSWGEKEQKRMKERRVITIHRSEGDAPEQAPTPAARPATDRNLRLDSFRTFPNPSSGQITIEFKGAPVATTLSMFDASGRQLYREEMNAFNGEYLQQFDLTEYAKGTIVVQVQQGDKLYSEQIVVN